ncbi:DUF5689 domain-containing protein [Constantimarinum furrinae]|uniref:DUF5689 domain-containing protein n=1 Tax=Constantimarinum furrinae TaxID=2562285 RepID=A0A7G8PSN8_9FLAO|nr:DUF5689 domain-containing protein [Constantimarinum furrinae]QNJ97354.1 hypothetical protein ALE3EI_0779 [Constantimarinum furrinae]
MKKSIFYIPGLLLLSVILLICCVQDDEFDVPEGNTVRIEIDGTSITIEALRMALEQQIATNGNNILTFHNDGYITGYVISSDEQGNFFEELIIQDSPNNGRFGVKVLLDENPLFQSFQFGRKVYVKLNQLSVGYDSGTLTLGIRDGNSVEPISASRMFDHMIRDTIVEEIIPATISIPELTPDRTNTYIQLDDVQFNRNIALGEDRVTYAGEPGDEFDGERLLESCLDNSTIIFSTSTFSNFKSVLIAEGKGSIDGIFTYNFFGDEFNIVVNDLSSVRLDDPDRCDPIEVDCGVAASVGSSIIFSEYFESQIEGEPISGNGWTNYIESGTELWEAYFDDGTNASLGILARIGSFNSGDESSIGWLVTPEIDFDAQNGESLNFKTSNSFADGSILEVLISFDWDGNPDSIPLATWNLLPSAIIVENEDFFGDWIFSENVDLSCLDGSGHIAWKYTGSGDEDFDGTYELDEINILSE